MPQRTERGAPAFSASNPRELSRYFVDLEILFKKCTIAADTEKKTWSTYYLSVADSDEWEMLPEYGDPTKNWLDFQKAVQALYPGSTADERYTRADLDEHLARWRTHGISSLREWAEFFRTYQAITTWLIAKQRFSAFDQGHRIFKVLDPVTSNAVEQRLMIKDPDHIADDAYTLDAINQAATYVLRGTRTALPTPAALATTVPATTSSTSSASIAAPAAHAAPAPVKAEPVIDALVAKLEAMSRKIDQLAAGAGSSGPRPRVGGNSPMATFTCHYCGKPGHGLSNCGDVAADIAQGYIQRDANNRVVMPNGRSPPANTAQPGETMRQRVFSWHGANPSQRLNVAGNYLATGDPEYQEDLEAAGSDAVSANCFSHTDVLIGQVRGLTPEEQIESYQQAIEAIRAKEGSARKRIPEVVVPQPPHIRKRAEREREKNAAPPSAGPSTSAAPAPAPTPTPAPAQPSAPAVAPSAPAPGATLPPLHPFANVRDATYLPAPVRAPAPAAHVNTTRSVPSVEDPQAVENLFTKILQAPAPSATIGELFSSNPMLCRRARDAFTPRKATKEQVIEAKTLSSIEDVMEEETAELEASVSAFELTEAPEDDEADIPRFPEGALFVNGVYVLPNAKSSRPARRATAEEADESEEEGDETLQTARPSVPLRSIVAIINHTAEVECIVDPGCQIIAMSEKVANVLGLAYDPKTVLYMTSANGNSNRTLGLAHDTPFVIGGLTLYFQVHIVREASYDILLGRPFDELTNSIVQNRTAGQVTITIQDPNSDRIAIVPTFERGKCLFHGRNLAPEEDFQ